MTEKMTYVKNEIAKKSLKEKNIFCMGFRGEL